MMMFMRALSGACDTIKTLKFYYLYDFYLCLRHMSVLFCVLFGSAIPVQNFFSFFWAFYWDPISICYYEISYINIVK